MGLVRDSNPGPRAPEARIIPLDQRAMRTWLRYEDIQQTLNISPRKPNQLFNIHIIFMLKMYL